MALAGFDGIGDVVVEPDIDQHGPSDFQLSQSLWAAKCAMLASVEAAS